MVEVLNLRTMERITYSLPPERAVIAAYAQERGDWNTWDYDKYLGRLERGLVTVAAGDWCASLLRRGGKNGQ